MPELPEVETIKNEIAPVMVGHKIKAVELLWDGMVKQPSPEEFKKKITGPITFKGYMVHASEEEPQYLIKSDKTDHLAMHKGSALKKISKK